MIAVFIRPNDPQMRESDKRWMVYDRVNDSAENEEYFDDLGDARSAAFVKATHLIEAYGMTRTPDEIVFMNEPVVGAAVEKALAETVSYVRVFVAPGKNRHGYKYATRLVHPGSESDEPDYHLSMDEAIKQARLTTRKKLGFHEDADDAIFISLEAVNREALFESIPTKDWTEFDASEPLPVEVNEREVQYIHLDLERQVVDKLKNGPMNLRMGDLFKLYRSVGRMLEQIDQDHRLALARASEVEQRVDATDERTRRTAEVERHLIEVVTFLIPAVLEAWDELTTESVDEGGGQK
jgi:hypothetical protein